MGGRTVQSSGWWCRSPRICCRQRNQSNTFLEHFHLRKKVKRVSVGFRVENDFGFKTWRGGARRGVCWGHTGFIEVGCSRNSNLPTMYTARFRTPVSLYTKCSHYLRHLSNIMYSTDAEYITLRKHFWSVTCICGGKLTLNTLLCNAIWNISTV